MDKEIDEEKVKEIDLQSYEFEYEEYKKFKEHRE